MGFLRSQLIETRKLPYPNASYAGQTIVITGSNTGLGKEAARHYARLGASRLILAVRNLEKGQAARKDIQTTAAKGTAIDVWELDMAKYSSVQAFAARVDAELGRVDIFHANAGVVCPKYSVTEGNETSVTINYVSTFLLAALVLPKLKATAAQFSVRPTLVITNSGAHEHTKFPHMSAASTAIKNGGGLGGASDGAILAAYPVSKLLGVFAVRSIAKERPADAYPVTVNMVSPGLCHSELSREAEGVQKVAFSIMKAAVARTTEEGSRTLVDAGVQGAKSHGQYLADCRIAQPSAVVLDNPDVQDRLWVELKAKLEAIQPGVTDNF
ncbi:short-chain dehydrogenase reductase family [Apiospora aurea]|uniref:Short-chain dehydrogenase reductase family n=1 Tax=Apiospora aurea TaxID=335848 RepID=A0ABR1PTA1_9PEZI